MKLGVLSLVAGTMILGCDRPPPADDLREWTAADHDRAEENARVANGEQVPGSPSAPRARPPTPSKKEDAGSALGAVIELTWQNQCAVCHGVRGAGDGPNGPAVRAPDLTSPALQSKETDEALAAVIRSGRGNMPPFPVGTDVLRGLVAKVRSLRAP